MVGEKLNLTLDYIKSILSEAIRGIQLYVQGEQDPDLKSINEALIPFLSGMQLRIDRIKPLVQQTDPAALQRIENSINEVGFDNFCLAFLNHVAKKYEGFRKKGSSDDKWYDPREWKEKLGGLFGGAEYYIDEWSELADGSPLQGPLKIISKLCSAGEKFIEATSEKSGEEQPASDSGVFVSPSPA